MPLPLDGQLQLFLPNQYTQTICNFFRWIDDLDGAICRRGGVGATRVNIYGLWQWSLPVVSCGWALTIRTNGKDLRIDNLQCYIYLYTLYRCRCQPQLFVGKPPSNLLCSSKEIGPFHYLISVECTPHQVTPTAPPTISHRYTSLLLSAGGLATMPSLSRGNLWRVRSKFQAKTRARGAGTIMWGIHIASWRIILICTTVAWSVEHCHLCRIVFFCIGAVFEGSI